VLSLGGTPLSLRSYLHSKGYSSRESIVIIRKMDEKGILDEVKSAFSSIMSLRRVSPESALDLMREYDFALRRIIELVMFGRRFMSKGESLEYYIDKISELREIARGQLVKLRDTMIREDEGVEKKAAQAYQAIRENEISCLTSTPSTESQVEESPKIQQRKPREEVRDLIAQKIKKLNSEIDPVDKELKNLFESYDGSCDVNILRNLVEEAEILQDKLIEKEREGDYEIVLKVRRILADRSKDLESRLKEALSVISEEKANERISPGLYRLWKVKVIQIIRRKGYALMSDLDFVPKELKGCFLEKLARDTGYRVLEDKLVPADECRL